jgi:hypothetical protein
MVNHIPVRQRLDIYRKASQALSKVFVMQAVKDDRDVKRVILSGCLDPSISPFMTMSMGQGPRQHFTSLDSFFA